MSAIMTSRQAAELDHALERNGFTAADVKKMSEGSVLASFLQVLRGRAEVVVKIITRHVWVNRSLTPAEAIKATGRVEWYIDPEVLSEMPRDGFEKGELVIFELDYNPSANELDQEFEARGLRPDPYALCQAMADDPAFADERPVATQWRDKRDRACYAYFGRSDGGRGVGVGWGGGGWDRGYRFAGVRK